MEIAQIVDEFVEEVGEPKEGKWYRREYLDLCETHKLFGKKALVNRLAIEMRNRGYYVDPITIHLAESKTSVEVK